MMTGSIAICIGVALVLWVGVPAGPKAVVRTRKREVQRRHKKERARARRQDLQMGAMLTEVATRLRSGATVEKAWERTLEHLQVDRIAANSSRKSWSHAADHSGTDQVCRVGSLRRERHLASGGSVQIPSLDADGVPLALRQLWNMSSFTRRRVGLHSIAVCRMGHATGAPMAEILDSCAAGVTEAGEARSARDVALAGPQSSARMLAVLPILGLALGYVIGANPFEFLLGSVWGHLALAGGIAFEIAGMVLVARMVAKAQREAEVQ